MFIATGSSDKTIRIFELTTGECHRILIGHSDYINCLEFNTQNPDYLASACKFNNFFFCSARLFRSRQEFNLFLHVILIIFKNFFYKDDFQNCNFSTYNVFSRTIKTTY